MPGLVNRIESADLHQSDHLSLVQLWRTTGQIGDRRERTIAPRFHEASI